MKRISFSQNDAALLYDIVHHCNEHQEWMRKVFDRGELMPDLEQRLADFLMKYRNK